MVKARTGRNKQTRQLVASHVDAADLTARITHTPGHTMQVDWAGTKMCLFDPDGTPGIKVSVFVASMPYSGMIFALARPDERQHCWLDAHHHAFAYFGGVPEVVVPDNASTASNAISTTDRNHKVNDTYEQFLEHYNTAALPTRSKRPKDKANVEAAVKIVTHKVIHALDAHQCVDLDELNTRIQQLVDQINQAMPCRHQQSSRKDIFDAHEKHLLTVLPDTPWQRTEWKRAKIAPDFHITVASVRYSVPHQLVGRTVDVRITGQVLTVFDGGRAVTTHTLSHTRGAYVTDADHIPANMDHTQGLWTSDYFLREAQKIGPATRTVIEDDRGKSNPRPGVPIVQKRAVNGQTRQQARVGRSM